MMSGPSRIICILSVVVLVSIVILGASSSTDAKEIARFQQDGVSFILYDDDTVILYDYHRSDIIIPSTVTYEGSEYTVTKISSGAFSEPGLISVYVPGTFRTLEPYTFNGCSDLRMVTLGEGVESISNCFKSCGKLESVHLPSTMKSIRNSFENCGSLSEITVSGSNPNLMAIDNVLFSKDGSTLHYYACGKTDVSYTLPSSVTTIGDRAISYNSYLQELRLNDGLTSIGIDSISSCSALSRIQISSTVDDIDIPFARSCASLESIDVSASNNTYASVDGVLFDKNLTTLLRYPPALPNDVYDVPYGVYKLEDYSFSGSHKMVVDLPGSLEDIDSMCFFSSEIRDITIPASVLSIGDRAFYDSCLETVTFEGVPGNISYSFPVRTDSLTEFYHVGKVPLEGLVGNGTTITYQQGIGQDPVYDMGILDLVYDLHSDLTAEVVGFNTLDVVIPENISYNGNTYTVDSIEDRLFERSGIRSVSIPGTIRDIGYMMFWQCSDLRSVTISEGVESLGREAFGFCYELCSIDLPSSLKSMDEQPFRCCRSLSTITVPGTCENFTVIDGVLFSKDGTILYCYPGSKADIAYTLPSSAIRIGTSAFSDNDHLERLYLNNGLKQMAYSCLESCHSLTYVHIPSTVSDMQGGSFRACTGLQVIEVDPSSRYYASVDGVLFNKNMGVLMKFPSSVPFDHYDVPEGVYKLEDWAFEMSGLRSVGFPSTLELIGEYCLTSAEISEITIPESVLSIGPKAFFHSSLDTVTFMDSDQRIGDSAFNVSSDTITEYYAESIVPLEYHCVGLTIAYLPLQFVERFTVTFVAGGTVVHTEKVDSGKVLGNIPDAPSVPGKEFAYWALDGNRFDLGTPITSDIALAAVYVDKEYPTVVAALSNLGGFVVLVVTDVENPTIPSGVTVNVTFTVLQEVKAFGQVVMKPIPVQRTFSVTEDESDVEHISYDLSVILGDNHSVISVTAQIGDRNFGFMTLSFRGVA